MDNCTVSLGSPSAIDVLDHVERVRLAVGSEIDDARKSATGQFFTPRSVAYLMASMLGDVGSEPRVLDAGAGVGSLSAAAVAELCRRRIPPREIHITAFEIAPELIPHLDATLRHCAVECSRFGIQFKYEVRKEDFLLAASDSIGESLLGSGRDSEYDCALLNPPYFKVGTDSVHRRALSRIGIQVSNAYAGFVGAAIRLLADGGQIVAITPRSFCNGPYFKPFRKAFLRETRIDRIHVFRSRTHVFSGDDVLQENVIVSAKRDAQPRRAVTVSGSSGGSLDDLTVREARYDNVIRPDDPESFVRVLEDDFAEAVDRAMSWFRTSLVDLDLAVSTGRVVDFRAREYLRTEPNDETIPLIYPAHFRNGIVEWPKPRSRKPNAIVANEKTSDLSVANGNYVLVKRFSSKEERRRVVAAVHDGSRMPNASVAFENHLNYVHRRGGGLPIELARGLAAFFNSTLFDTYFRQFSGHTQVNAADLRNLSYPTERQLEAIGKQVGDDVSDQGTVDDLITNLLQAEGDSEAAVAINTMKRVDEALQVLRELGFPRAQLNERSALTLLALLALKPDAKWSTASQPLMGITPLMEFFAEHYGKRYAPNTRETVRRQTVHQFLDAGLIVANPDQPDRPVNSGKNVYQVNNAALELARSFGSRSWKSKLTKYLSSVETLKAQYARERKMSRIPINLAHGQKIALSPGRHNTLIRKVIEDFAERFTPGGRVLYVGDTDEKFAYFDEPGLRSLGVVVDIHGKMPDAIIHHVERNWLVLVEAVTSHGPVNPKRHVELSRLFADSAAGLVFVTAFLDRKALTTYLEDISWETEVWVADSPSHLIHFNGERFLGPH
ncbi:MAG: adenine methyltransferase [Planctomycetota bacterium]|nr:MAG: adenine methyltransferase [Planctomycetota bacterium]